MAKSIFTSVRPHGTTRLPLDGFPWNFSISPKSVEKNQVSCKSDKNKWHSTLRAKYVFNFNIHGSVHRNNILIYIQQDATLHSLFISWNRSRCFGWYHHPSSGAQTTVSTVSGICHTVMNRVKFTDKVYVKIRKQCV